MSSYKMPNGTVVLRGVDGRFRRATGADFGVGVCSNCQGLTVEFYDGDLNDRPCDPRKFRQRCYRCEPKTELRAEQKPPKKSGFVQVLEDAAQSAEL